MREILRRQTGYRLRHKSEDLRERSLLLCIRAMGKEVDFVTQKNGCGSRDTAAVFCFWGVNQMQDSSDIVLTKAEKQLIQIIRSLDYGEVRVMIKDRHPIRVEEIRKSIQLPSDK